MSDIELFAENELTVAESDERVFHEKVVDDVKDGIEKLASIGDASLKVLRDKRLYRSTHKTFEEYCRARFGFDRRCVNRQIFHSAMQELLGPNGPKKEAQSRPLTSLPNQELQAQAWTQAQADSGKDQPSNREVAEAVAKVQAELAAERQARDLFERRALESQAESNERRKKIRELEGQIDLLKAQPAPEPERVYVSPADYDTLKAESARLRQQIDAIEARKDQLVQQQVVAKLKEREREIESLEHRANQLKGTIDSYQSHIARVHLPEMEMQQQIKVVEDFIRACAGLAAGLSMFEHAPNAATASIWQKGIAAASDAAQAMRLHVDRRPELIVIQGAPQAA